MVGLVVTMEKGEQEETTLEVRICGKSSRLQNIDDKSQHHYPIQFFVLYALD